MSELVGIHPQMSQETRQKPDFFIDKFIALLGYSEEQPEKVIDSTSKEKSKWRKVWFAQIVLLLDLLVKTKLITSENSMFSRIKAYESKWTDPTFINKLTEPNDIQEGNQLISAILQYLKKIASRSNETL